MSNLNDTKQGALQTLTGNTGHESGLEHEWLDTVVTPDGTTRGEKWQTFLAEYSGTRNERMIQFLTSLGYTGTLNEQLIQYWAAGGGGGSTPETDFLMTVRTTTPSETFTIPCNNVGTFNATIDWGDGGGTSTITAYNDADLAHTYATAGDYQIRVSGTFPNIYFNNAGDKLKVISVDNLGSVGWTSLNRAFYGCSNLASFTVGDADTALLTTMEWCFVSCTGLTSINLTGIDTSNVTTFLSTFFGLTSLLSLDASPLDTSSALSLTNMFRESPSAVVSGVDGFNVASATSATSMFLLSNAALSTSAYDAILIAWAAQTVNSGVSVHFGDATYSAGAAATARATLVTAGWTITDGGPA